MTPEELPQDDDWLIAGDPLIAAKRQIVKLEHELQIACEAERQAEIERDEAERRLSTIQGALADAGTVLANRTDGDYAESVRELTRERDEYKRLWELRGKALARPCGKCGYQQAVIKTMEQTQ